jgi:Fic family protein
MREADFQLDAPGILVSTEFPEGEEGETRRIKGLAFVPRPLPPKLDRERLVGRLYDVLDEARTALLRLEGLVDALPAPGVLLGAMRLREAQESSRIENTIASLKEMALAEAGATARSEPLEVLRNRRAIEYGLESTLPVSGRLLREMHRVLMGASNERARPGQFRDRQVYIGDEVRGFTRARFVPPPPGEHLDRCVCEWELFVNPGALQAKRRDRWPELVELALAHYQFEAIHPFSDGNGRLGRALVHLGPVKSKFLKHPVCNLSEWIASRRQEYYDRLLRVSTHAAWEDWIAFFCKALAEQATADCDRARRLLDLRRRYHELATQRRASVLLIKLIDRLFEQHAISISEAASYLNLTYPAAQKHVEFLESQKVLTRISRDNYGKLFVALGVIAAIRGRGGED